MVWWGGGGVVVGVVVVVLLLLLLLRAGLGECGRAAAEGSRYRVRGPRHASPWGKRHTQDPVGWWWWGSGRARPKDGARCGGRRDGWPRGAAAM